MKKSFLTSQFDTPDKSPGFLLWQTYSQWHRLQSAALSKLELTHVQFVLLAGICWLEKQGKDVAQITLANHACTDPMMTSQVVRTLEKYGYIIRKINRNDQRQVLLSSTLEGKKLLTKALIEVENVDDNFFKQLQEQKASFIEALKTLLRV